MSDTLVDDNRRPSKQWRAPSDEEIRRRAVIRPEDIADAIKHLRQRMPDLAQKWGLNARRPAKNPRRTRR